MIDEPNGLKVEEDNIEKVESEPKIVPKDLKVTELKAELKKRGLDTSGLKAALVNRLDKAIKNE